MNNYPHPRPTVPVQLYLLAALAGFGLLALWLAAFHAFLQVAGGPQAFFAATLIEAGLLFLENLTHNYRREWDVVSGLIVEDDALGTKEYFSGSTLAALAYGLQFKDGGTAPLYLATNFGFFDISGAGNGLSVVDLLGTSGPVELDKAHVTLGNLVLSAS